MNSRTIYFAASADGVSEGCPVVAPGADRESARAGSGDGVSAGEPASALKRSQGGAKALLRLQHAVMEVSVAV